MYVARGEIEHAGQTYMPGQLLVFKAGDKVKFKVISKDGKMIVTEMKPAG